MLYFIRSVIMQRRWYLLNKKKILFYTNQKCRLSINYSLTVIFINNSNRSNFSFPPLFLYSLKSTLISTISQNILTKQFISAYLSTKFFILIYIIFSNPCIIIQPSPIHDVTKTHYRRFNLILQNYFNQIIKSLSCVRNYT